MSTHTHSYSAPRSTAAWQVKASHIWPAIQQELSYIAQALAGSQEPHIWQHRDANGQLWWHAYDPVSDRQVCCDSEAELRIWLESRYYL